MTTEQPIEPLVPPEVDLRDFQFMPLDVVRLRDSGLTAKATGDEFRAAVLLWCASWHQIPAGSLPGDDDEIASICGYARARRQWAKVRDGALRGWKLATDGRYYHPAVATKALEAWIEKLQCTIGGLSGNFTRWKIEVSTEFFRDQLKRAVLCLKAIDPKSRTLKKKAIAILLSEKELPKKEASPPDRVAIAQSSPAVSQPDRNRQGQGQYLKDSGAIAPVASPSSGEALCGAEISAGFCPSSAQNEGGQPALGDVRQANSAETGVEAAGAIFGVGGYLPLADPKTAVPVVSQKAAGALPEDGDDGDQPVESGPAHAPRKPGMPPCPVEEIIAAYHEALPALPRVLVRNAKRDGLIRARWREVFAAGKATDRADGLALFREFFEHVSKSRFLTGRSEPRNGAPPFVADLEWLMRPTNFAKVIEGRYHRG